MNTNRIPHYHSTRAVFLFAILLTPPFIYAQQAQSAAARMNERGPENSQLAEREGVWDVTETIWGDAGTQPTVFKLVAERKMIGNYLQEVIEPAPNSPPADVKRIDYLSFNRVEGRWKYVSMDTRAPVGIMPALSYERIENGAIVLRFDPLTLVGAGTEVTGQMLRLEQVITYQGSDRDTKDQYFLAADGTGNKKLAHRYAYTRHK